MENPANTDPTTGAFRDYTSVVFPADVKNCTACHTDDRWMTKPSRLACGACHDNIWFGAVAAAPATAELHLGGSFADDLACAFCHNESVGDKKQVSLAHKIDPPALQHTVSVSVSNPANGTHFVAGETPTATITVKDAAGNTINPSDISVANGWRRAYLYVSGPRALTVPVLTKAATDHATPQPYDIVTGLPTYYADNDFRKNAGGTYDDPRFASTATAITYQLDDVAGLKAGTYSAWVETMPASGMGGWALINFQVGTATAEKKIATNCTTCHADTRMHAAYFAVQFNPDICKNCHDYRRQFVPDAGKEKDWTARNAGFGAAPLARRVHGVHFGRYLDKPKEVHSTYDFSEVIFPQDVRNCSKCHSEKDATGNELLSGTWKTKPSRLACLACHDSDGAIAHGTLMTTDPTPADPWSGDEVESCNACHGAGREFSPDKVHNISNPYKPPYPREPAQ
ncbi:MAG: cytochrome c3 family protein [Thermodesulfobacteriota bacterium]